MAAYQVQIEPSGYTSGAVGFIEPIAYASTQESGEENRENFLIEPVAALISSTPASRRRPRAYRHQIRGIPRGQYPGKLHRAGKQTGRHEGVSGDVETPGVGQCPRDVHHWAYQRCRVQRECGSQAEWRSSPSRTSRSEIVVLPDLAALMAGLNGAEVGPRAQRSISTATASTTRPTYYSPSTWPTKSFSATPRKNVRGVPTGCHGSTC